MKLSILIPVYNEIKTIMDVINLVGALNIRKEMILVDDCSTDGTREMLKNKYGEGTNEFRIIYHKHNKGKGAAIQTAIAHAEGDYIIVQDGDLEYSPHEIVKLIDYAEKTGAEVIYGSRFLDTWRSTAFMHYLVNWFLTALTNMLFGSSLTDMETCYKMVRTDIVKGLGIRAERFDFEPEITSKLLKKNIDIKEVAISYRGRGYDEGKKITWTDGIEAVIALLKYRFTDE